jgi:2-methylcitrate dehydratase PrpD
MDGIVGRYSAPEIERLFLDAVGECYAALGDRRTDAVHAVVDDRIDEASADVTAHLKDGRQVHVFVEHAIGSMQNPMSDAQLEGKFHSLADAVIGAERAQAAIAACWGMNQAPSVQALLQAACPR